MSREGAQLPLLVKLQDQAVFASFYSGPNTEIVSHLRQHAQVGGGIVWLWGEPTFGKSHLLQAVCSASENSAYLPGRDILPVGAKMLKGFEHYNVVCIDDIDLLVGQREWDRALFALYNNLLIERQHNLVISSTQAPNNVGVNLQDLKSRLLSGPVFRLQSLSDGQRLAAVQLRAKRRGLDLPDKTGQFLLKHFKRDMRSLCEALDQLDTASLVHQRRLTIPLVKSTLLNTGNE